MKSKETAKPSGGHYVTSLAEVWIEIQESRTSWLEECVTSLAEVWIEIFMIYTHKNPSSCVRGISDGNTELMECWVSEDWEVIGNIYDDPELLEDKENSNGKNI